MSDTVPLHVDLRPYGLTMWALYLHGENPGEPVQTAASPEYLRLQAKELGHTIVEDIAQWAHDNIQVHLPTGTTPGRYISEWSMRMSGRRESAFIKRLRASRFADDQIVMVLACLKDLCLGCFNPLENCDCDKPED